MDPDTAKSLVSAALVVGIAGFSLASLHAALAQVAEDLRNARRVPIPVEIERRPEA